MAYSTQRAVSDGTMAYLDVSIQYMKRGDISVFYNDLPADPATWAWVGTTDKRIAFTPNVPNGVEVLLKRSTQINTIINVFSNGAKFNNATMDQDFTQLLYLNQEAVEGAALTDIFNDVDFHGYKIKNLGLAVDDTDAITFGQAKVEGALAWTAATAAQSAQASSEAARDLAQKWASQTPGVVDGTNFSAKQYALNASGSATSATASQVAAASSASAASGSASAAASSASAASGSASAASGSASAASTSMTNATASATLAANWAAQASGTVDGVNKSAKQYAQDAAASAGANVGKWDAAIELYRGAGTGEFKYREGTVAVPSVVRWELYHAAGTDGAFLLGRYNSSGTYLDSPISVASATGIVTLTDGLSMNSKRITSVLDPTSSQDAATKAYADTGDRIVLLSKQTVTAASSVVFTFAGYDVVEIDLSQVALSAAASSLALNFSSDGGATWLTSANHTYTLNQVVVGTTTAVIGQAGSQTAIVIHGGSQTAANGGFCSGRVTLHGMTAATAGKTIKTALNMLLNDNQHRTCDGGGGLFGSPSQVVINAVRLNSPTGATLAGTFTAYGRK